MKSLTPHGEGFSFLDTFEATSLQRGYGTKYLDPKLPFFADHFPGKPMMPAVLLIECAAQTAGALWATLLDDKAPKHFVLAQILQFKILRAVLPGEEVKTEVVFERALDKLAQFVVVLWVQQDEIARGRIVLGTPEESITA